VLQHVVRQYVPHGIIFKNILLTVCIYYVSHEVSSKLTAFIVRYNGQAVFKHKIEYFFLRMVN